MKITTKTGDKGETSLFGGKRVSKASFFIGAVGELDELQALIGWCRVCVGEGNEGEVLARVIDDIYRMMSVVGFEMKCPANIRQIDEEDVEFLEKEMAKFEEIVGGLSKFIRPGITEKAARLHIARTVCRRVERGFVEGMKAGAGKMDEEMDCKMILKYLNRLSDLLFVLAYSFEKKENFGKIIS
ncbi:MAG: cob(I)yrinic acid a,c-diamide adenosyltransferase [Patescibacteria group bacterium]